MKPPQQEASQLLHRARDLVVRQRIPTINMLRCLLAEYGIVFVQSVGQAILLARRPVQEQASGLSSAALDTIIDLGEQSLTLHGRVNWYVRELGAAAKCEPRIALFQTIPGIGPIRVSAIVATVGSAEQFRQGRGFSAWVGLTPINRSTGGKERLGRISNWATATFAA